jgi:hypothetical protein
MPFCTSMAQAHGVNHAAELNDGSIAGALDHPAIVNGDYGVDQIAPKRPQPRQYAILVRAGKSAVADHIRHQNRRELPGLDHGFAPSPARLAHRRVQVKTGFTQSLSHRWSVGDVRSCARHFRYHRLTGHDVEKAESARMTP